MTFFALVAGIILGLLTVSIFFASKRAETGPFRRNKKEVTRRIEPRDRMRAKRRAKPRDPRKRIRKAIAPGKLRSACMI